MKLYSRDYCKEPTKEEKEQYAGMMKKEEEDHKVGRCNLHSQYPEAIRHHKSLFPNNHIELIDCKNNMELLIYEFDELVHNKTTSERDILEFINKKPAYFIIGSLLLYEPVGHHEKYIFPEFQINNGEYRADYLIIGKGSGGYEYYLVELEAPNGRTTLKSGHSGHATRSGLNQISDWKVAIEGNYKTFVDELSKMTVLGKSLPNDLMKYDSSRFHYIVVTGTRDDYTETTYRERREKSNNDNTKLYHYDNLIDYSKELLSRETF